MPLSDEQLRGHLRRRAEADSLAEPERLELLNSVRAMRRPNARWNWLSGAAAATAAVVVGVVAVVALNVPRATPAASPSASATSVAAVPTDVTATASPAPRNVLTAQQLADLVGGDRTGEVVIGEARLQALDTDLKLCPPLNVCTRALLEDATPATFVSAGWRSSSKGMGTLVEDEDTSRWLARIDIPDYRGLFAFKILSDSVEFLGPVAHRGDAIEWSVDDIERGEHGSPSDNVFAVRGWLVAEGAYSCPAPRELIEGERPDMSWYCSGSWVAPESVRTVRHVSDNQIEFTAPGGLRVENNAYAEFADSPDYDDQGSVPREGVYLVRSAGCQVSITRCPVWSLVGRLDAETPPVVPATTPVPRPVTTPAPSDSAFEILSGGELLELANQPAVAGRVVVAETGVEPSIAAGSDPRCLPPLCVIGRLTGAGDGPVVLIRQTTGSPDASTLGAFRLLGDALEYLGPVRSGPAAGAWKVSDVRSGIAQEGVLYAVDAWLTQPPDIGKCRDRPEGVPEDDPGYWCNASWLTSERVDLPRPGRNELETVPAGALQVQNRAYTLFAHNLAEVDGVEPWRDVYLIRQVGCPPGVLGDCPVWELIANLNATLPSRPVGCTDITVTVDKIDVTSQQLAGFSDVIVIATALKVGPGFWDSPSGERPITFFEDAGILTLVETSVESVLKGDGSQATRIVTEGGTAGCDTQTNYGTPELAEGMRYVLFLTDRTAANPNADPSLVVTEAWPVVSDGHVVDPSTGALLSLDELGAYLLQPVEIPVPVVR